MGWGLIILFSFIFDCFIVLIFYIHSQLIHQIRFGSESLDRHGMVPCLFSALFGWFLLLLINILFIYFIFFFPVSFFFLVKIARRLALDP